MQGLAALTIIPVIGWFASAVLAFFAAIPLYFLWTWLAPVYFPFVPNLYLNMPFWDLVGILVLIGFIKLIAFPSAWNQRNHSKGNK